MKHIILAAATLLAVTNATAQDNTGTIVYEQTIKFDFDSHPELKQFAAMMPEQQSDKQILYYTPDATIYKSQSKPKEVENSVSGNSMQVKIQMDSRQEIVYKDLKAGISYEQKEFMGRQFLVTGNIKQQSWKMTGKQQEISGYPCQEATMIIDKDTVWAWFTPAIPVATGPSSFGNLPGMILEARIGKMVVIKAVSITPGKVDMAQLVKPKSGKKVSHEEYEKIVAAKTKEMQEQFGGSGKSIIIRTDITE